MPRKIPENQQREAARMVVEGGLSAEAVAKQLGMSDSSVHRYVALYRKEFSGGGEGLSSSEREELKRLRRDNAELRMERDILKKAAAYFAKNSQ